jgi:hypothetical protein
MMGGACRKYGRDEKYRQKLWLEELKVRDRLEDLGVYGRIMLKTDLKYIRFTGSAFDSFGSGYGPVTSSCEYDNGPSGSMKGGQSLKSLGD